MGKISVVINTLNEEKNLPKALASIKNFADEIVVVDMHSDDNTVKIAKKHGAKIYKHKREGYVEPARNFAIKKAKGDWTLILDADEEVPEVLAHKLKEIASNSNFEKVKKNKSNKKKSNQADGSNLAGSKDIYGFHYYRLPRKNIIFGKWIKHSRWWPDHNIRFFKKGYVQWNEVMHSVPITTGKGTDLPAIEKFAIVHNHYETIEQYIERLNRYTSHHAKNMKENGKEFSWKKIITAPSNEFLGRYFQGEGYKDGLHGLALASLQAFSELVLQLKLWQLDDFRDENLDVTKTAAQVKIMQKDLNYWIADTVLNEKGGLVNRLKRKFKLP